jgi:hypothetical protein
VAFDAAAASAAMTVSQHLEMHMTGREPSDAPVATLERITGRAVPAGSARVVAGHVSQGALALVAVAAARTVSPEFTPVSILAGGVALVGADALLAIAMGLGPPPWRWTAREALTDLTHKTVLAGAATYLSRRRAMASRVMPIARVQVSSA